MFSKKVFGQRLKNLRCSRKMTQTDLAAVLSVTKTQISDLENAKTTTSLEKLVLLCEYFEVSADYLLGLSDLPDQPKRLS